MNTLKLRLVNLTYFDIYTIEFSNLACNSVRNGFNTAVITLEMADKKFIRRIGANLLNIRMDEYVEYSQNQELMNEKIRLFNQGDGETLQTPGNLYIKEYPTSSASVVDFENYLRKLEDVKKMKLKLVVIDYVNIIKNWRNPNSEDLYGKIKQIAEDLRAMAIRNEWNITSATQLNRCLSLDTEINIKNKGKIKIKDISINDYILTEDGYKKIINKTNIIKQKVFLIKTKSGKQLKASGNHIFPTINGDVKCSDLNIGSNLFCCDE